MAVAQDVHGDTSREIQIFLAILPVQIGALTPNRSHLAARVDGHERRNSHSIIPNFRANCCARYSDAPHKEKGALDCLERACLISAVSDYQP
jgi:hypothetical protein